MPYGSVVAILILLSQTNELIIRDPFGQGAVPLATHTRKHISLVPVCVGNGDVFSTPLPRGLPRSECHPAGLEKPAEHVETTAKHRLGMTA